MSGIIAKVAAMTADEAAAAGWPQPFYETAKRLESQPVEVTRYELVHETAKCSNALRALGIEPAASVEVVVDALLDGSDELDDRF